MSILQTAPARLPTQSEPSRTSKSRFPISPLDTFPRPRPGTRSGSLPVTVVATRRATFFLIRLPYLFISVAFSLLLLDSRTKPINSLGVCDHGRTISSGRQVHTQCGFRQEPVKHVTVQVVFKTKLLLHYYLLRVGLTPYSLFRYLRLCQI